MITQGEAKPRWEWRTFDTSLNAIEGRIAGALEHVAPHTSAEIYLLRLAGPQTERFPMGFLISNRFSNSTAMGLYSGSRSSTPNSRSVCASIEMAPAIVAVIVHCQRVMVANVAEFVVDNSGDFVTAKRVKKPSRRADGGVPGISSDREGIGLRTIHQVDPRHRQAGTLCQFAYDGHEFGRAAFIDFLGVVHR